VLPIANDARSYLRTTDRMYDMIVYGLLDSHTLLSHASSVRLDSFVYTVEGFREARARLKPGGILVVSFSALTEAIGRKMYEMLRQAFDGAAPAVVSAGYDGAVVFLQTKEGTFALPPGAIGETGLQDQTARYRGGSRPHAWTSRPTIGPSSICRSACIPSRIYSCWAWCCSALCS